MAVQGENTVFMFNYEKIEWTKPSNSFGCHDEIAICPYLAALVSLHLYPYNSGTQVVLCPFFIICSPSISYYTLLVNHV